MRTRSCRSTARRSRPRPTWTPTCTSSRRGAARPSALGREMDLFHVQEEGGLGVLAPARLDAVAGGGEPSAAGSTAPAMSRSRRPAVRPVFWERSGHWEKFREQHVHAGGRGAASGAEADELPGPRADLQPGPAQLPRPAVADGRVRLLPPQRAVRRSARHHAGARLHRTTRTSSARPSRSPRRAWRSASC